MQLSIGRAAVLGQPIAHSLSPVLHAAAYAALDLPWTYEAIECDADRLEAVLAARPGWAGFSCTMPLKREALRLAAEHGPGAIAVGAANTLLPLADGGWRAENTDATGILAGLRERDVAPVSAAVLGAGGTAQAAVAALGALGLVQCTVLVRDPGRTVELRQTAARVGVALDIVALDAPIEQDLVISTLPRGVADRFAARPWRRDQAVLDAVYDPWPTAVAAAVAAAGGTIVSGALMLLHQAAAQVELMTGRPAPVEAMRTALRGVAPRSGV